MQNNIYPLSLVQKDIWLDQIYHGDTPLYNIGGYLRFSGQIDVDMLREAHRQMVEQNDGFRIMLRQGTRVPGVEFAEEGLDIPILDFSKQGKSEQEIVRWWEKEFSKPFALYDTLMARYYIARVSDEVCYYFNTQHHLMTDGWSYSLLTQRMAEAYNSLLHNRDNSRKKPSYADFILSDQAYLLSHKFQQAKEYWKEKFAQLPPPLVSRRYASKYHKFSIPGSFSYILLNRIFYDDLDEFARQYKTSIFHIIIAVLYTYFLKTSGAWEFVFSIPALNRPSPEFKATIGPFTSVSPVRIAFGLNISLIEFLGFIKKELLHIYRYQRFPLSEINRQCGIYKTGRNQLFDIGVSYEKYDYKTDFNGTPFEVTTVHNGYNQNALTVAVKEYQERHDVKLEFYYSLGAFQKSEIDYLMKRIQYLLDQVLEHPDMPLGELEIIPPDERRKILTEFSNKAGEIASPDTCIHHLFEEEVRKNPESIAVVFQNQSMTYRELDDKAHKLSCYLHKLGAGSETFIGVFMERSIEIIVAILGVLKAGAAYIPLDPDYPEERIKFMIQDSEVPIILTLKALISQLPDKGSHRTIILDDPSIYSISEDNTISVEPSNLAYIIYTSGTTGTPKGVMCTHQGVSNLVKAQNRIFHIKPGSKVLQFASFSFDASVSEIFTTLSIGATLYMAPLEELIPGPPLLNTLAEYEITHITLPPSTLAVMQYRELPSLETLVVAGESCPVEIAQTWRKERRFINAYGPSEATVCATTMVCNGDNSITIPIGKPIDNVTLYILDDSLNPVPIGNPGQLYIGGMGVAVGYLKSPDPDREKFIPNPFKHTNRHNRLYKTGDIARLLPDGNFEFIGRADTQVKLRGFRIELSEIETILSRHFRVKEAAVIVKKTRAGDKGLQAFFTLKHSESSDSLSSELKQYLREILPEYMIPPFFMELKEFPLTFNGKIDRKTLENIEITLNRTGKYHGPESEMEKRLIELWHKIMKTDRITGIYDDLFEAGMDSLKAIEFITAIEKEFDVTIQPSELMEKNTIDYIARYLEDRTSENSIIRQTIVPIKTKGINPPFFCITAGYGDIMAFKQLSDRLSPDQPFFMLQPPEGPGIEGDVKDLANRYVADITGIEPDGPYLIGGYSAGGLLAFETAKQLYKKGRKTDLLIMFGAPFSYSGISRLINKIIGPLMLRVLPDQDRISSNTLRILHALFKDKGLQRQLDSLAGYIPHGYNGKIVYFQGMWATSRFFGVHRLWKRMSKDNFELHFISGNHDSYMRPPYVEKLAECLTDCINRNSVVEPKRFDRK